VIARFVRSAFTAVGRKGDVRVPAGGARTDLTGKTVMPAMVDIHSHRGFLECLFNLKHAHERHRVDRRQQSARFRMAAPCSEHLISAG
jgi:predicted amidohydrolase YtcJ